jgi:hypothetical protein
MQVRKANALRLLRRLFLFFFLVNLQGASDSPNFVATVKGVDVQDAEVLAFKVGLHHRPVLAVGPLAAQHFGG